MTTKKELNEFFKYLVKLDRQIMDNYKKYGTIPKHLDNDNDRYEFIKNTENRIKEEKKTERIFMIISCFGIIFSIIMLIWSWLLWE